MTYWVKTYGPGVPNAVAVDENGDIIVVGYIEEAGHNKNGFVIKLDKEGNVKWSKQYGGSKWDEFNDVRITPTGDIIVAGGTTSFGIGEADFWVLRLDSNGNVKWQKTYGGNGWNWAFALDLTENGDIVVVGYTNDLDIGGTHKAQVLRLDGNGNIKWQKTYRGNHSDRANAVAVAPDGDIIVAGYTTSFGAHNKNIWVFRLDARGNIKWQKRYEFKNEEATAVTIAPDGNILITGSITMCLDPDGNVIWSKNIVGKAIIVDSNKDVIVVGNSKIIRLDPNGNVKWKKTCGKTMPIQIYANAVALAPNRDIIVANHGQGQDTNIWIIRIPPDGNLPSFYFCQKLNTKFKNIHVSAHTTNCKTTGRYFGLLLKTKLKATSPKVSMKSININPKVQYYSTFDFKTLKSHIRDSIDISIPNLTEGVASTAEFSVKNDFADSLKLSLDLTHNQIFDLETASLDFPELKKGQKISKTIEITPMHAGVADFGIRVKAIVDGIEFETWRKLPVSIKEYPAKEELLRKIDKMISISSTQFIEGIANEAKIRVHNFLAESLSVFLEFYGNDQVRITPLTINIRGVKKHEEVTRTIKLIPKSRGTFNITIRIKAVVDKITLEKEKTFQIKVTEHPARSQFLKSIKIHSPPLVEGSEGRLKVEVYNTFADSFEVLLRFSENKFIDVNPKSLLLPKLKRNKKGITNAIKIIPKQAGEFKLDVNIEAIADGVILNGRKTLKLKVDEHPAKKELNRCINFSIPKLVEETSTFIKMDIENTIASSLKLTLDLLGNEFFDLERTSMELPVLKKGQKITKTIAVRPKYAGNFDFRVKIKGIADGIEFETEKVIPVEVAERTAQPYATPSTPVAPATPPSPPVTQTPTPSPAGVQLPPDFPSQLAYKYTDVELMGKGGFARVYKAKRKDGKVVAVKIPLSLDENTGRAFLREITNWLHLKHPNIVRLYDVNILPIPFLEMEYCESSLEKLPKPLPVEVASSIVFNIAEGLKYAHSKGIIHRDLKPSNILLKNGTPKISDWGLSKVMTETHSTTLASFTPFYASPEQTSRRFGKPDHRSDIWQLGVIFYQLVTGRLPFEGDDLIEVVSRIATDEPVPPGELNPEAKDVEHIILTCLRKDMEERYQSVAELQFEMATYLGVRYKRELKRSITVNDASRAAFYAGKLMLMFLKMGNLKEAYKYASDLKFYARGELTKDVESLAEQIKLRLEEGLSFAGEELLAKAEVIAHKVSLGFEEV